MSEAFGWSCWSWCSFFWVGLVFLLGVRCFGFENGTLALAFWGRYLDECQIMKRWRYFIRGALVMVTRAKYDVLENVVDTWRGRCLFSFVTWHLFRQLPKASIRLWIYAHCSALQIEDEKASKAYLGCAALNWSRTSFWKLSLFLWNLSVCDIVAVAFVIQYPSTSGNLEFIFKLELRSILINSCWILRNNFARNLSMSLLSCRW